MVAAAVAGLGVTLVSRQAVRRELDSGLLVELPVAGTPLDRPWHVVTRSAPTAPTELLINHLMAHRELGWQGTTPIPHKVEPPPHFHPGEGGRESLTRRSGVAMLTRSRHERAPQQVTGRRVATAAIRLANITRNEGVSNVRRSSTLVQFLIEERRRHPSASGAQD